LSDRSRSVPHTSYIGRYDMNGWDVLRLVRRLPSTTATKINTNSIISNATTTANIISIISWYCYSNCNSN
jgi:hypothetical protein